MFKLIMADIKVLGKRIWIVPFGVLLVTVIAGLVLRDISNSVMFINAAIVPVIFVVLSYSLMYYSENSKLQNEIGSLPCSTKMLVFEKYLMVLIFLGISYLSNTIFLALASLFHDFNFNDVFTVFNITIMMILTMSMLAIPLFFKYRSAKTSYFGTFIWVAGLGTIYGTVILRIFPFNENISMNVFLIIILLVLSSISALIIKFKNKVTGDSIKDLLIIPVVSVLPATVIAFFSAITSLIIYSLLYHLMLPGFKRMFLYDQTKDADAKIKYLEMISENINHQLLNGLITFVLIGILVFLWRRGNIKGLMIKALRAFIPLFFFVLQINLMMSVYTIEIILSGNSPRFDLDGAWMIAYTVLFVPMLIVSIYYSKKFLTEGGK
jgi:hypothetical protein